MRDVKIKKIDHLYNYSGLYNIVAMRGIGAYAREAEAIGFAINYTFASEQKSTSKELRSLEMFSGGYSRHFPFIKETCNRLKLKNPVLTDIIDHGNPDILIGDLATMSFTEPFDIIYNPWENFCGLVRNHKGAIPDLNHVIEVMKNMARHLKKDGIFVIHLNSRQEDYLNLSYASSDEFEDNSEPVEIVQTIPPWHLVRKEFDLDETKEINLVSSVLTKHHESQAIQEHYIFKFVEVKTDKLLLKVDVKYPNILLFWTPREYEYAIRQAGMKVIGRYVTDEEQLTHWPQRDSLAQQTHVLVAKTI